jgi:hypothetical protein
MAFSLRRAVEANEQTSNVARVRHITTWSHRNNRLVGAAHDLAGDASEQRASERSAGPDGQAQENFRMIASESCEL